MHHEFVFLFDQLANLLVPRAGREGYEKKMKMKRIDDVVCKCGSVNVLLQRNEIAPV